MHVVGRNELMDKVWPGVTDDSITQCVAVGCGTVR